MVAYPAFLSLFILALLHDSFALYAETRVYSNTLLEYGVIRAENYVISMLSLEVSPLGSAETVEAWLGFSINQSWA